MSVWSICATPTILVGDTPLGLFLGTPRVSAVTVYRPSIFGKYCLLERISVGGMAEVFRAKPLNQRGFERYLALKRILPHLAEDDEFITMFVDEARIAVQLHHRNICQIYELGRIDDAYYIVMEFIAGKDLLQLQNWFRKRRKIMSVTQACYLAMKVCEGLDYAHRKEGEDGAPLKIIHRDISPQNVLISFAGDVKVIDFGIARAATSNQQTQVGVLKGKFGYMSPEQVAGGALDHRSDVFACGTLLWEMLTARRLFHGETDFATLEKVRSADIQPPSARNKRVPPEVDRIVARALSRDRDARYAWAREMADDLRAFLQSVPPAYDEQRLAGWMRKNFDEQFQGEIRKRSDFQAFVTDEDVREYRRRHGVDDVVEDLDVDDEEATRVWAAGPVDAGGRDDDLGVHIELGDVDNALDIHPDEDGLSSVLVDASLADTPPLPVSEGRPSVDAGFQRKQQLNTVARVLGLVLAVGLVGAAYVYWQSVQPVYGQLDIAVTPAEGVTVKIDGVEQYGGSPWNNIEVEAGERVLEIRHADYATIVETVVVPEGDTLAVARALERTAAGLATVELALSHPQAQVYVDGELVGGMGATRRFEVEAATPQVVEVFLPNHFVETFEIDAPHGATIERGVSLQRVRGALTISSEPVGTVLVDGADVGHTGDNVRLDDLSIMRSYDIEIRPDSRSFRTYRSSVIFDTYYDLRLRPRLTRRGMPDEPEEYGVGYLATGTGERWYRVFVDDRDTGLVTPIAEDAPLPIRNGSRRVAFVRPGDRREVTVDVPENDTVVVPFPASP